jgi:hypothetical protein
LAAVSAGCSLLIEEATDGHLSTGASAALGGGCALYLVALLIAHAMTRRTLWRQAVRLKFAAAAGCVTVALLGFVLPPVATVALLLLVLLVLAGIQGSHVRRVLSPES